MGQIFSSKSQPKTKAKPTLSQQDRAVLDLKLARDKLKAYQGRMESESATILTRAQGCLHQGNKRKAIYYMKVKKLKEAKIDELKGELLNIERMVYSIEWATQSLQVVRAMEAANGALEAAQKALPLERVDALMDAVLDTAEAQAEVDRALCGGDGQLLSSLDESDLEAELAALEAATPSNFGEAAAGTPGKQAAAPSSGALGLEAALPTPPEGPVLPDVPSTLPALPVAPAPNREVDGRALSAA